jgi:PAS domain S-box-containing protein
MEMAPPDPVSDPGQGPEPGVPDRRSPDLIDPPAARWPGFEAYLLDQVQAAVVATSLAGVVIHWNRHAEVLFGWARDEALGRDFKDLLVDPSAGDVAAQIVEAIDTRQSWEGEVSFRHKQGRQVLCYMTMSPIHAPDGRIIGAVSVSVDIMERKRADRRLAARTAVTRVLSEAATLGEATPRILQAVCESLEWDVGAIWTVDDASGKIRCIDVWHRPEADVSRFGELSRKTAFPPGIGLPGRVWASGRAAWIEDVVKDTNFPRAPVADKEGLHGAFGFPIVLGGTVLGVLEFFSREIREPDEELLETLGVIGSQIGQYLDRIHAEAELKTASEEQRFLVEASTLLTSSLDYEAILRRLAELLISSVAGSPLADWCVVHIQEIGALRQLPIAHPDPSKVELVRRLGERYPPDPQAPRGAPEVIRTGRSELYPEITDALLAQAAQDAEHLEILRGLGFRSAMVVPLVAAGRSLGAITLVSAESGRRYGPSDLTFAEDLGRRAGLAVQNARLFKERDEIARKLQESLLPPKLPLISGFELASRYRPAGEGSEVGGDFFDVFATGDGGWTLVIGDVCGKGPDAAAVTGLARYTLRATAMQERKPSRILETLNEAILQQRSDHMFCTVSYVRLKAGRGKVRLTVCCGGHPQPLVLRADGRVEPAGVPGTLLGVFPDPELTDKAVDLDRGDALVLYTDGVVEEHVPGAVFGKERLISLLESCAGLNAASIVESIERAVMGFQPGPPRDDIALLVLRMRP